MNEAADASRIHVLLERSEAFEEAILTCFTEAGLVLAVANQQHELVATACTLCIEHASVLRAAFAVAAPNSGAAVLRLQYEALLRAAWLLYAASPSHIERLARALDLEAELRKTSKTPSMHDNSSCKAFTYISHSSSSGSDGHSAHNSRSSSLLTFNATFKPYLPRCS